MALDIVYKDYKQIIFYLFLYMENTEYKGFTISIDIDEDAQDPREDYAISKMALFHNRYSFPNDLELNHEDFNSWEDMEKFIVKKYKPLEIRAVYMYDHSGISFSMSDSSYPFNCRWDSGQVGFILITAKDLKKEGLTEKDASSVLKEEFNAWNSWASGEMYQYSIKKDGQYIDGCGGFYDYDQARKDAKDSIDSNIKVFDEQYRDLIKAEITALQSKLDQLNA